MTTQFANAHGAPGAAVAGRAAGGGFGGWLAELVRAIRQRTAEHECYVRTRNELTQLTDRELADIGLSRGDIEHVARRAARPAA